MSLYIASLNSGSNGNCYYISNGSEAILIDAGVSCKEIEKRMRRMKLSPLHVKAVFISHEHIDHVKGVAVLSKRYEIPVYITPQTLRNSRLQLSEQLIQSFTEDAPVMIGDMKVTAFTKLHDAIDPYSFTIQRNDVTVGVFTDLGRVCDNLTHHFTQCHAAFLEANYDEVMLETGRYPLHLKNRIRGGKGHLSNREALELFLAHKPAHMSHLFLAHLSKENNDPRLVHDMFNDHADGVHVAVASRYEETEVYHITSNGIKTPQPIPHKEKVTQISLF